MIIVWAFSQLLNRADNMPVRKSVLTNLLSLILVISFQGLVFLSMNDLSLESQTLLVFISDNKLLFIKK